MNKKKLLIIGLVWPEPTSSAAGTRMVQLINLFLNKEFDITFACAALKSDFSYDLIKIGVKEQIIKLNDESFNHYIKELNPDLVMFDRYVMEEQYGWRVQQICPNAMTILDTEDLHFLRHARHQAAKINQKIKPEDLLTITAKRELAAILRCDLSLIISEEEMNLLQTQFKIDKAILHYLPFLEDEITSHQMTNWIPFDKRADLVFIGNFLHEPNWHTVLYLKTTIWPKLREKLPGVNLNIYGAYTSQKALQLHQPKENFNILGRAIDARSTISKHKILLAPIQFGAGVKGKFIDAMQVGTPSITSNIGAEAMQGDLEWSGFIADDVDDFIAKTVMLYQNHELWLKAQQNGMQIINQRYNKYKFEPDFNEAINQISANLKLHRQQNFLGQLLSHHHNQSTKYMSLWIEEKNKNKLKN